MGPPRQPAPTPTSPAGTAHSLQLLTEYTHSLDSLPLDLSRNFADLRELDAVLSSSMTSLTSKVTQLTHMIETKTASNEDRLWLLADIAEEASRLKPGADDKIRVACHAADGLRSQKTHMTKLLEHMPDQDFGRTAGMLARKTVYPHVSDRTFAAAGVSGEGGRGGRRRTLLANTTVDATPNKRKRVVADDGDPNMKSPRKERTGDVPRPRNGGARKKCVVPFFAHDGVTHNHCSELNALPHPRSLCYQWHLISSPLNPPPHVKTLLVQ
ncbi:hypothetical protein EW026_g6194 [Hermanssonia centrifuga]|uniref:Inhibitor of growth protein N-terminal histone-binding domain-containing protein n=1 Tax=Hermanssonia centrifuga TaxID=98765 RepID=A0A4S4KBT4_9APHY|nr:hypothetical protein EW026_g6194 [Hermanssonia centrifuga]